METSLAFTIIAVAADYAVGFGVGIAIFVVMKLMSK